MRSLLNKKCWLVFVRVHLTIIIIGDMMVRLALAGLKGTRGVNSSTDQSKLSFQMTANIFNPPNQFRNLFV